MIYAQNPIVALTRVEFEGGMMMDFCSGGEIGYARYIFNFRQSSKVMWGKEGLQARHYLRKTIALKSQNPQGEQEKHNCFHAGMVQSIQFRLEF